MPYTREWAAAMPTRPWPTIWTASPVSTAQELALEALADEEFAALDPEGAIAKALEAIASLSVLNDVKTTRQAKAHLRKLFPGVTPFETPKPEELMARIIEIGTNEGDIVLDCFAGSGSTLTTAHKLGRRWVGIEWEQPTLETFTGPRLQKVVEGKDEWGISKQVGWEGGGGFRVLDVAPSMFAEDEGTILLADWAVGGELAEATAAQLGFVHTATPPFAGMKGKVRLAVIDGLVNSAVAELLVNALDDKELLVLCGTAVDPDTREVLRRLRPGSTVRKIPSSILAEYRRTHWTWPTDSVDKLDLKEREEVAVG